jgi:1,5-anhydro-D-fructose reductase (1,5-anhydro-D-mannitol-forming)
VELVQWGMIGCGDVAEIKAGPALRKAAGSALVAVMRRDTDLARDYARRHGVPTVHVTADDLIGDPQVNAVYIATPPSSHYELALKVARAGKPCLVEKPMATSHRECIGMRDAFRRAGLPLWVAYYRRALPRYLLVRELLQDEVVGSITSVQIEVFDRLATGERALAWRFDPSIAGGGLFLDMGTHCMDMVDFLLGPIEHAAAIPLNTGRAYRVEDVTTVAFRVGSNVAGCGVWNFNAGECFDLVRLTGGRGTIAFPMFTDGDVVISSDRGERRFPVRNPPHVHQPLVETIVQELMGRGRCDSTAESGCRTAKVMETCLSGYRPFSLADQTAARTE